MNNWLVNTLAIIGLVGISSHWYYLNILDISKNKIEKGNISIQRENVRINVQKIIVQKARKKAIIKEIVIKEVKEKLLNSGLSYNGYIKGNNDEYIAVVKKSNKSLILRVGGKYGGGIVTAIDTVTIQISGYKTIYINGFKKNKEERKIEATQEKTAKTFEEAEIEANKSYTGINFRENKFDNKITKTSESHKIISVKEQEQETRTDNELSINKNGEPRILRSLIREIKEEPNSIYKYVSLYNSLKGVKVIPKENYTHIFFGIGLRIGDVIKEINGHSVKSPSILLQAINVANKTNIKLLLENNGQSRVIVVNLMKVFKI